MRKVVVYELLSLDGVAEDPDGFFADWDDAMEANLAAVIAAQDAVILGRRSYDEWAEFWPGSEIEPFATFINGVVKYVMTSAPLDQEWANASVVDGGLVDFVRNLRDRPCLMCLHVPRPARSTWRTTAVGSAGRDPFERLQRRATAVLSEHEKRGVLVAEGSPDECPQLAPVDIVPAGLLLLDLDDEQVVFGG